MTQYQQARKQQQVQQQEQKNKEDEAKWLNPETRQKHIDKIKSDGAAAPKFLAKNKDWNTPGVFPEMWQKRLKVDRDGEPLKEHPLKNKQATELARFWLWTKIVKNTLPL